MNPAYSSAKRDVQTMRCCGIIYKRWRFSGLRFFKGNTRYKATHCRKCGVKLTWPINFSPEQTIAIRAKERTDHYYDVKVSRRLNGLNSKGKPWGRTPTFLTPEQRLEARRARGLKAWKKRSDRLKKLGCTTRGTKPKKDLFRKNWNEFRTGIKLESP